MKSKGLLVVLGIVAILFFWGCSQRNSFVNAEEDIKNKWSEVQNQYKRRAELFMNQSELVKGAAANEKGILASVINARSGIQTAKEGMDKAQTPEQLEKSLGDVDIAARNFMKITVEAYPNIRSTEAFLKFQDEVSGTENRVSKYREDYINIVTPYNKKVRNFPGSLFASMFGFKVKENFKAKDSEQDAPKINVTP